MSVAQAQAQIDAREFAEWVAYFRLEPWGEERADIRSGIVACVIANQWRGKGRAYKPSDFIPKYGREARPRKVQTAEYMESVMRCLVERTAPRKKG